MPKIVVKKDGRKEEFVSEKIVASAVKSGATSEIARTIAKRVEDVKKDEIRAVEIRDIVLKELKDMNADWHNKWLAYDKGVKRLYRNYRHGLYR